MKIGYVLAEFPVFSETFVGNEMRAMEQHGHMITPMTLRVGRGACQPDDIPMVRDRLLQVTSVTPFEISTALALWNLQASRALEFVRRQQGLPKRSLVWNALKVAAIARRSGCQHLHAHFSGPSTAHAIVAAHVLGIPVSFICHGHDVYQEPIDLELKMEFANFVVGVSADMCADLAAMSPATRVEALACSVDPTRFSVRTKTASNGRLLFVGRLVEQKGLDDVLAALAKLAPPTRPGLDIVGSGPLQSALQQMCEELGLTAESVRFLGAKPSAWIASEAPNYMGFISAFKQASDGSRDGSPVVIKEAMAMGLPIVSTRYVGLKETISPDTGDLVEVGDIGALAGAIARLTRLSDSERRQIGLNGRQRVIDRYSLAIQARELSALIETAAKSNRNNTHFGEKQSESHQKLLPPQETQVKLHVS